MNLIVTRDGHIDNELSGIVAGPTAAFEAVKGVCTNLLGTLALEAKLVTYDAIHNTNYRTIRHDLVRQERNKQFEAAIGLVAIKR